MCLLIFPKLYRVELNIPGVNYWGQRQYSLTSGQGNACACVGAHVCMCVPSPVYVHVGWSTAADQQGGLSICVSGVGKGCTV